MPSQYVPPPKPKFVTSINWLQKIIAGISGSTFLMSAVTLIPFISNLFSPDYLVFLSTLRAYMAATSLVTGCMVGVPQIVKMVGWLAKFYEFYRLFTEANKTRDDENK